MKFAGPLQAEAAYRLTLDGRPLKDGTPGDAEPGLGDLAHTQGSLFHTAGRDELFLTGAALVPWRGACSTQVA
ncbi:hypothetical protein ACFPA8_15965 [Streptomyces ovatisporus]|uniref:Uncharacterized protein n=1 Tax=Streptomyces ovatisporus TaxID=1128682 RepID=A0ABV9A747_9ACTN